VASKRKQRSGGFTLIELIITVTVATAALALAISGYKSVVISNRLSATTNSLIEAIKRAQIQAIKSNIDTQFCSNSSSNNSTDTLGAGCPVAAGAVYWVDPGTGKAAQLQGPPSLPSTIAVADGTGSTAASIALRFAGSGLAFSPGSAGAPYTGLVADVYSAQLSSNNHRCIYMATGSQLSSCAYTGSCPGSEPNPCQP
jgi:type IV fimbrial biogenesis protein FimT